LSSVNLRGRPESLLQK